MRTESLFKECWPSVSRRNLGLQYCASELWLENILRFYAFSCNWELGCAVMLSHALFRGESSIFILPRASISRLSDYLLTLIDFNTTFSYINLLIDKI